jgi:alpha-D-xyloside xylohydrolase
MPILNYQTQLDGLLIESDRGRLLLTVYSSRAIRIRYTERSEFSNQPSLMIMAQPDWHVRFIVRDTVRNLIFSTADVTIEIDKQTTAFTYRDRQANLLTREPARGGKTLDPIDVYVSVFDDSTAIESRSTADGVRVDAANVRKVFDRQAYHTKLEFEWAEGEALYGLGSHEEGMFNLRGQHQYLYQQNMKTVVPVLVSTRSYCIFMDSCSLMTFHDDAFGSYLWSDVDDELDYVFIYGPEFDQIIYELRALTGQAPLLPKWAYGYLQSKERYASQSELIEIVREYRARQLPLDGIVLDWKSWTGDLWGQKSLDPDRFPDPDQMTEDLHALHAHLMVSIWPIMKPGGDDWQELHDHGFLLGNQANYDAFNPAARACYWQQANRGLFAHGIDAWWCDCTEPFEADWKGAVRPEPEERLRLNTEEAKRYLDPGLINAYSLLHSAGIYHGQRKVTEDKRVVNLTRSPYLGQQRYATITWSGDVVATWATLRRQIADGLNFCVTGLPYWTTDIGAFFVGRKPDLWFWSGDYNAGVDDLGYRELYVRWFQFGAFLPMFRPHGTDTPREIWRFGQPGEPMYDALVKVLNLRYRLLPYIYSLAGWTTQQAYTMLRSLPFDFRSDPAVHNIDDQFMFGSALLVNPVTSPMYYMRDSVPLMGTCKTRSVYLPAGTDWYDFWTDQCYHGGQTIEASATIDMLPLYVRAGSIVPLGPRRQHVDDQPDAPIELHIYPGSDGCFLLYEDEGDSYHYEQGAFATIQIEWDNAARRLTLGQRAGQYPGMPEQREFRVIVHDVKSDGRRVHYDGQPIAVDL